MREVWGGEARKRWRGVWEEEGMEGVCSARTWPREWEGLHVCSFCDPASFDVDVHLRLTRTCANEVFDTV
jgi:hypothetical protein